MHLMTPPVGSALWLEAGVTPSGLGYAGTWERRHFVIVGRASGRVLDAKSGGTENGTSIQLYDRNDSMSQTWWMGTVVADTTVRSRNLELWVRTA